MIPELVITGGYIDHRPTNMWRDCALTHRMHQRVTLNQFFCQLVVGPQLHGAPPLDAAAGRVVNALKVAQFLTYHTLFLIPLFA